MNTTSDASSNAELVKDVSTESFMTDVVEASKEALVLVDFWATWCGPCKQLGPALEKVVNEAGGAVRLAKMDIDKYPEVAGQMGVQSVPAVFAFKDGRPVDAFMGAVPESQIKQFIEKNIDGELGGAAQDMLGEAEAALENSDIQKAVDIYASLQAEDPENMEALAGLARCFMASGDFGQARVVLSQAPENKKNSGIISQTLAELELMEKTGDTLDVDDLANQVSNDENNHQLRFDYALALGGAGQKDEAAEQLLEIVRRDGEWNEQAARKQLVQFFEAWGHQDPLTIAGRRKLAALLF